MSLLLLLLFFFGFLAGGPEEMSALGVGFESACGCVAGTFWVRLLAWLLVRLAVNFVFQAPRASGADPASVLDFCIEEGVTETGAGRCESSLVSCRPTKSC